MIHARPDYNRIQDPLGKIPHDEPVFLLRGQDLFSIPTLEFYIKLCELNDRQDIADMLKGHLITIQNWQEQQLSKIPDLPS